MEKLYLLLDAIGIVAKQQGWKRTARLYDKIYVWKAKRLMKQIAESD